jgi:hypothetical protein
MTKHGPTPDVIEQAKAECASEHNLPIEAWSPSGPRGAPVMSIKLFEQKHFPIIRKDYSTYMVEGYYNNGHRGGFSTLSFDVYESAKVYFDGLVVRYGLEIRT